MNKYTAFITGANKGLGLEFARQYAAENWKVLAACRNLVQAKELRQIAQHFPNITLLQLDVTNLGQLDQITKKYENINIDVLIHNASLIGQEYELGDISVDGMKQAFITNAVAPLKISEFLLENVSRSHLKTIIALSSKMASIKDNQKGGAYTYRTSKAALNMIMKNLSVDLKSKQIKVFTFHPGWVKKQSNVMRSVVTAEQSVFHIRSLLNRLTAQDSGNFYDYMGNLIEW